MDLDQKEVDFGWCRSKDTKGLSTEGFSAGGRTGLLEEACSGIVASTVRRDANPTKQL